tara:strand:+ start:285 stop:1436 length:1152 start_codon:yes stop_codon:yes gene_type:complete
MARNYLDWTEFDSPMASLDLLSHSIKSGIKYDSYGEQTLFKAIVLNPAKRIDSVEARALGIPGKETMTFQSPAYKFKIRIVEENSPHMLLPDPCNLAINADRRFVESVIELHTDVVFFQTGQLDPPGAGDIIEVELHKNDFSYNLQKAEYVRTIARNSSAATFLSDKGCTMTFDIFDKLKLFVDTPLPHGGPGVNIVPKNNDVVINEAVANFAVDLRKLISQDQIKILYITSGVRTAEMQARALINKRAQNKCHSAIAGAPSPGDPCYPVYSLYKQRSLILEALQVPNDVSSMTAVFERQVANGKFVSGHMTGLGIDIRTSNITEEQRALVIQVCNSLGGRAIYEGDPPHIHVGIPKSYRTSAGSELASNTPNDSAGDEPNSG